MTVLTVTLNAAIDKRYDVHSVGVGRVQRVERVLASPGGKGLNVARGAQLCGQDVIATGFVAGFAGQFVTSGIVAEGIGDEFLRVAGETRTCINIIDADGRSTEFLEPGPTVTAADLAAFERHFAGLLARVDVVTISGSAPNGCPADVYAPLIRLARVAGRPVILDASGAFLARGLEAAPSIAKPNLEELSALVGTLLPDLGAVVAAARTLCAGGTGAIVVSLGGDGAVVVTVDAAVHVRAPRVPVLNPVGCGDVLVGGLATGLARGWDLPASLELGVRVSAAAAAHPETGRFDPDFADRLAPLVSTSTL